MFSNTQLDHLGRQIFLTGNTKNLASIVGKLEQARSQRPQRTPAEYTLNVSTAYGFPISGTRSHGELRIEVLNVTDQQRQRDLDGRGEVYPVRRFFQRPRQARASFAVRF